jgi:hypothetical protein
MPPKKAKAAPKKAKVSPKRTNAVLDRIKQSAPCFAKLRPAERKVYLLWSLDMMLAAKQKDGVRFIELATSKKPRKVVDKAKCR